MQLRTSLWVLIVACCLSRHAAALTIEEATIADVQAAYVSGRLTAHEVVQSYLERINAYDQRGPHLNSIINLNAAALAEADELDAKLRATGKLPVRCTAYRFSSRTASMLQACR